ncbi:hypothetical protein [Methylobacterium tardum]|uniref:hypothetical protein n=1 Tax=Methylobacterium tardum TaxID=374432 RepID=UPI0036232C78
MLGDIDRAGPTILGERSDHLLDGGLHLEIPLWFGSAQHRAGHFLAIHSRAGPNLRVRL